MGSEIRDIRIPLMVHPAVDLDRLYRKLAGISGHDGIEISYGGVVYVGLSGGEGHQRRVLSRIKRVIETANESVVTLRA
jgi:hypothetical protein